MYLKIVILFFCVELYFLQCHCDEPTKDQIATISTGVRDYGRSKGYRHEYWYTGLQGVKEVIELVAGKLNKPYEPFSLDDLKEKLSRYRYTVEECKRNVKEFLNCLFFNQAMERLIDDLYNEYSCDQQDGISFDDLKALLGRIPVGYNDNPPEFSYPKNAKTAVSFKVSRSTFDEFFSEDVTCIVILFFFPKARLEI